LDRWLLKMNNSQKQHCWCYRGLGACNTVPPAAVAQVDQESPERKENDAAVGEDCGWEYEVMDSD